MIIMFKTLIYSAMIIIIVTSSANSSDLTFAKKKIEIISAETIHYLDIEIAISDEQQTKGLSDRKTMPENNGMLFLFSNDLFGNTYNISMWMKDTYIPLDMVFIKHGGIISSIKEGVPLSLESIESEIPIVAVLELKKGTCKKLGIKTGDKVVLTGKH